VQKCYDNFAPPRKYQLVAALYPDMFAVPGVLIKRGWWLFTNFCKMFGTKPGN